MPPKAFKPPRPSSTTPSTSSRITKSQQSARSKPILPPSRSISSTNKGKQTISKPSTYKLPSLSPNTSDEEGQEGDVDMDMHDRSGRTVDSEDEDEEDEEDAEPRTSSTGGQKSRRKSGGLETSLLSSGDGDDDAEGEGQSSLQVTKTAIPPNLISVLLQMHWNGEDKGKGKGRTRIQGDASLAVGKYVDVFVREAVARAAWMGSEEEGVGDGGLEVEKLERLAPQLLLDF